jgi:NAD(P)-dependent dehydrogenase (short-subunit alcohol dehydrogenase family)
MPCGVSLKLTCSPPSRSSRPCCPGCAAPARGTSSTLSLWEVWWPSRGLGAYHGTKFAMIGVNDALAQELRGIRVTAVLPGDLAVIEQYGVRYRESFKPCSTRRKHAPSCRDRAKGVSRILNSFERCSDSSIQWVSWTREPRPWL